MNVIDILKYEHRIIEHALRCLDGVADRWNIRNELTTGTARKVIDVLQHFADGSHHHKEEELLFPLLKYRGVLKDDSPISLMLSEHITGRTLIKQMKNAIENYEQGNRDAGFAFVESSRQYIPLLKRHIAREDHDLFETASSVLLEQDQLELMIAFAADEALRANKQAYYLQEVDDLLRELRLPPMSVMNKNRSACRCMDFMSSKSA